jgi:hypothetical protein
MVRRENKIDENSDHILTVHACKELVDFADRSEAAHADALRTMRDRSEADFREGRTVTWEDVKARNGL